jgi:hypothetical protein
MLRELGLALRALCVPARLYLVAAPAALERSAKYMFFTIFKVRFFLAPLWVLLAVLAVCGVARWYTAAACALILALDMLYYSSDDARIVYWLQGYRKIQRSRPLLTTREVKQRLSMEFAQSKKNDGSFDSDAAPDAPLDVLIAHIIRIEFRFKILAVDVLWKRFEETKVKVRRYAKALQMEIE